MSTVEEQTEIFRFSLISFSSFQVEEQIHVPFRLHCNMSASPMKIDGIGAADAKENPSEMAVANAGDSGKGISRPRTSTNKAPLPMGWTQIRRRPPASLPGEDGGDRPLMKTRISDKIGFSMKGISRDDPDAKTSSNYRIELTADTYCCPDPTCIRNLSQVAADSADTAASVAAYVASGGPPVATLQGMSVLLLPSIESRWFQGHFVPQSTHLNGSIKRSTNFGSIRPIGLLAVERDDTDECLQCRDGGYREVDLTILGPSGGGGGGGERKRRTFDRSICTGGDMIRLRAGRMADQDPTRPTSPSIEGVAFDAERVLTGRRAAPYLVRYFSGIVTKMMEENSANGNDGGGREEIVSPVGVDGLTCHEVKALEALPDCAIILGEMICTVPVSLLGNIGGGMMGEKNKGGHDDDDSDGFMSD